mmetsp:Transcript_12610/g.29946  ORF Transcript_12610/g.29946 Transcript_12610/m.29946 type:complete len:219 (+) Transcript_12610:137-793(+)
MPKRLKILGLHGFRTNGNFLHWQLTQYSKFERELSDLVEIICLDAPNPASGPIPDGVDNIIGGPYFEWWRASRKDESKTYQYIGLQESLTYILDFVRLHGPFDGVLGFSQGGTMAGILAALLQSGKITMDPAPRLCIIIAGLPSRDLQHDQLYEEPIRVPSLFIWGERDPTAPYTKRLADKFADPVRLSHPGGHVVPPLEEVQLERIRRFLAAQQSRL